MNKKEAGRYVQIHTFVIIITVFTTHSSSSSPFTFVYCVCLSGFVSSILHVIVKNYTRADCNEQMADRVETDDGKKEHFSIMPKTDGVNFGLELDKVYSSQMPIIPITRYFPHEGTRVSLLLFVFLSRLS